jgi:hypothetical protein
VTLMLLAARTAVRGGDTDAADVTLATDASPAMDRPRAAMRWVTLMMTPPVSPTTQGPGLPVTKLRGG